MRQVIDGDLRAADGHRRRFPDHENVSDRQQCKVTVIASAGR
jgi:hypothetical protein